MSIKEGFEKVEKTPEEVQEIFRSYVSSDRYLEFIKANQMNFKKISEGKVSGAMTLNNFKKGTEYVARVFGVIQNEKYKSLSLDCIYKQPQLRIADSLTLRGEVVTLTENQKEELQTRGRLNEVIETDKGSRYFIAVDNELNRLTFGNADKFKCHATLHGVELSEQQQQDMANGRKIVYERENPINHSEMLVLEAFYNPTLMTISSNNMIDENGNRVVKQIVKDKSQEQATTVTIEDKQQKHKTSTLEQVEVAAATKKGGNKTKQHSQSLS